MDEPPDTRWNRLATRLRIKSRQFVFFEHDLRLLPRFTARGGPYRFERATLADIDALPNYPDKVQSRDTMRARLARGDQFFILYSGDQFAWLGWAQTGEFLNIPMDQPVRLPNGIWDLCCVYTVPEFRNRGLAKHGYECMLRALRDAGARRLVLQVLAENRPSLASVAAAGFVETSRMHYVRLVYPRMYSFTRPGAPRSARIFLKKRPSTWFDAQYLTSAARAAAGATLPD